MSYVAGVGDEVLGVLVAVVASAVIALLWKTTQVRDHAPIQWMITGDRIFRFTREGPTEVQRTPSEGDAGGGGGGAETEQEEVSEEEEVVEEESSSTEDPVNIKLRFLDDSELDVTTKLSECLKKFRRRHLDTHLSLSPADKVKLIFNGKIIHRDAQKLSEAGIYDKCTVHCLVQRVQPEEAVPPAQAGAGTQQPQQTRHQPAELDLATLCFPLLGSILFLCWWFALFYSQYFTMLSMTSLASLTVLYAASVANMVFH